MRSVHFALALLVTGSSIASAELRRPDESPHAQVTQTVGISDISVLYARPAVKGRPVWGGLVQYGEPWRAGANLNTIVTLSTDAKIGGKLLRAGRYGLHAIPTTKDWVIAFSNVSTAWGSFTYDIKEDALRVTVTPRAAAAPRERLEYRFDDLTETKATLVLAWEKLEVPIAIEVDTAKEVMTLTRALLRGPDGFDPANVTWAANYWLNHNGNLDEALRLADRSIAARPTFAAYNVRARILTKQGKNTEATAARAKAMPLATEADLNVFAYQLMADKKVDEAIAMFRDIVTKFPESWNAHDSLGEALAVKGDKAGARAEYEKALAMATDPVQKKRIQGALAQLK
jgi:tetratricopeptide (TPR) repeat protein